MARLLLVAPDRWILKGAIALLFRIGPKLRTGRHHYTNAKIIAFLYVVESRRDNDFGNAPVDPMTGKPLSVTDKGNTVEIRSDGERGIRYEVQKRSQ